jgi:hypothetical protein
MAAGKWAQPEVQAASSWCSLPGDVFNTILERLPPAHRCVLPQVCSAWRSLASSLHSNANYWRNLSLRRWGPAVLQLAPPALHVPVSPVHEAAAWRRYYVQRVAWFNLPTSPHQFIQEDQRGDPWRVMVACQVSSRTGASLAKHDVLGALLSAFPSPSAMMGAPADTLAAMMVRVGMQEQRAIALTRMSEGFLGEWQVPSQLYGIGSFGQESVYLFQRGAAAWPAFKTNDTSLSLYLSWARKDLKKLFEGGGAERFDASDASEAQSGAEGACLHTKATADENTERTSLHSRAQAHLMACCCPPHMRRDSARPSASAGLKRPAARGAPSPYFACEPSNRRLRSAAAAAANAAAKGADVHEGAGCCFPQRRPLRSVSSPHCSKKTHCSKTS